MSRRELNFCTQAPVTVGTPLIKALSQFFCFISILSVYIPYIHICVCFVSVSERDYRNCDCLIITVLTHGMQNDLIYAKDHVYNTQGLWSPFTPDKCKSLAGKPKIFIIQVKLLKIFNN